MSYTLTETSCFFMNFFLVVLFHYQDGGSIFDFFKFTAIFNWQGLWDQLQIAVKNCLASLLEFLAIELLIPISSFIGGPSLQISSIIVHIITVCCNVVNKIKLFSSLLLTKYR